MPVVPKPSHKCSTIHLFLNTTDLNNMRYKTILWLLWLFQTVGAQLPENPFDLPPYSFISYNSNRFELVQDNPSFDTLFSRFDSLITLGKNQIHIVHLGGSHLQADIYTHRMRQELQSFYPGVLGSRGFFFPYSIAHTNSPSNLRITSKGEWETCKNTQPEPAYPLGLSGITSILKSPFGQIEIVARYDTLTSYDFNLVRIFCNADNSGMVPEVNPGESGQHVSLCREGGYVEYHLDDYTDTLVITVTQPDSARHPFELYGISLENDDPGVIYNSIGVNGAKLESYNKCGLFVQQLRALDPEWVIISIGTNEGNTRQFDAVTYRSQYLTLLDSIRSASPGAAILMTVPNDSYILKRYINNNTARMREIIFDIARTQHLGVWDFYTIMGGLNSVKSWYSSGLMNKDHIHFNKPGYLLKGDLFYAAFLKSWEEHLDKIATIGQNNQNPIFIR
jgi:lysophospholipase L1-like esterase